MDQPDAEPAGNVGRDAAGGGALPDALRREQAQGVREEVWAAYRTRNGRR